MKKYGGKEFKSFDGDKAYDPRWKSKAYQHNATIVENGIEVCWCDLNLLDRTYQSRVMDISKGHVNDLANDIANNNLETLPTVEWDSKNEKFTVLGGHHRLSAISKLKKGKVWKGEYPVAVLEFKNEIDRIKYLAADNDHKPVRGHSQADAARFLKQLFDAGEFDNCRDEVARKKSAYRLLTEYFPKVYGTIKQKVYENAFRPIKVYKNWQTKEITDAKIKVWNIEPNQRFGGSTAYVHGNNTQWGNSVSNMMNEHLKNLQNGTATSKLGIKLMSHIQVTDKKDESGFINSVKKQRNRILEQATLKNIFLYEPADVACIEEVVFLPQILAPKKEAECVNLVYSWDTTKNEFKKVA